MPRQALDNRQISGARLSGRAGCGYSTGAAFPGCFIFPQFYCDKFSTIDIFPCPPSMSHAPHLPIFTLARAKVGERLRVVTICPDCPECLRLRELGFQDRVEVRKIADGAALICSIMGMRVAIGRDLGEHVRVEKIAA
jgi:Fe2+ transport system protein FeoA